MKKLLLLVLLLAGCSAQAKEEGLVVTLQASDEQLEAFEPVKFTAVVTHNGEAVTEGADIFFELIKEEEYTIGTVNPTNAGDGKYIVETSFDEAGVYKVISHVTVNGLHEMPFVKVELK